MISSVSRLQAALSAGVATRDRGGDQPADAEQSSPVQNGLSVEEQRQVDVLRATDRNVRAHELAHIAAGAGLTGAASFTYQLGPDNQRYAVAGEVSIDISSGGDPGVLGTGSFGDSWEFWGVLGTVYRTLSAACRTFSTHPH
ncbi:hypothetical protein CAP2UW1_4232 [Candidatus Accumulibacter phosphatis]|uniref:SprA-related family protein n=1 Tax=Accumulibacter regalis TaxID=522306 RepID=C7RPH6_ACCRE